MVQLRKLRGRDLLKRVGSPVVRTQKSGRIKESATEAHLQLLKRRRERKFMVGKEVLKKTRDWDSLNTYSP